MKCNLYSIIVSLVDFIIFSWYFDFNHESYENYPINNGKLFWLTNFDNGFVLVLFEY